jgi:hypothetical protein
MNTEFKFKAKPYAARVHLGPSAWGNRSDLNALPLPSLLGVPWQVGAATSASASSASHRPGAASGSITTPSSSARVSESGCSAAERTPVSRRLRGGAGCSSSKSGLLFSRAPCQQQSRCNKQGIIHEVVTMHTGMTQQGAHQNSR